MTPFDPRDVHSAGDAHENPDGLNPARGVVNGVKMVLLFWAAIGLCAWAWLWGIGP